MSEVIIPQQDALLAKPSGKKRQGLKNITNLIDPVMGNPLMKKKGVVQKSKKSEPQSSNLELQTIKSELTKSNQKSDPQSEKSNIDSKQSDFPPVQSKCDTPASIEVTSNLLKEEEATPSITFRAYSRDFLLSFKNNPNCRIPPADIGTINLIEEIKQDSGTGDLVKREKLEDNLRSLKIDTTPKKWVPKTESQKATSVVPKIDTEIINNAKGTVKKVKETSEQRLASRQKQIDIGKNTDGYRNYLLAVPKSKRRRGDPQTPNKHQTCSKRSWDGQVRKWRRLLHQYDINPNHTSTSHTSSSPQS